MHIQRTIILVNLSVQAVQHRFLCCHRDFLRVRRDRAVCKVCNGNMVQLNAIPELRKAFIVLSHSIANQPVDFSALLEVVCKAAVYQVVSVNLAPHAHKVALMVSAAPKGNNRQIVVV